ncbi:hypothetical protein ACMU6081_27640 [Achromobacter mucicolens]
MVVQHLAMQALDALVRVDFAGGVDGLDGAFDVAALTGVAAVAVALEPVEDAQPGGDGQGGAQRAQVAAEEALDEQARDKQRHGEQHEGPVTHEVQDDRGLEGLDFGELLGDRQVIQREAEKQQEDHVLERGQPLRHTVADLQLTHAQPPRDAVGQFLQRAERAQPAAERAAVPEHHGDGGGAPQDEHQRVHQEVFPAEIGAQGREERQHVHDGQLRLAVPADPEQREGKEGQAQAVVQQRARRELVLKEEDAYKHRQGDGQDGDLAGLAVPDLFP